MTGKGGRVNGKGMSGTLARWQGGGLDNQRSQKTVKYFSEQTHSGSSECGPGYGKPSNEKYI